MLKTGLSRRLALWFLDVVCVLVSYEVAVLLRFGPDGMSGPERLIHVYLIPVLLLMVTFLNFVAHRNRGFMKRNPGQELVVILGYNFWLVVGVAALALLMHVRPIPSRLMLLYFALVDVVVMSGARALAKRAARALLAGEHLGSSILVVFSKGDRRAVERRFETGASYTIAGWLELDGGVLSGTVGGTEVHCEAEQLPDVIGEDKPDDLFVFAPDASEEETVELLDAAERMGASCHIALNLLDPSIQGARLDRFGGMPTLSYPGRGSRLYLLFFKRVIDIVISLLVVVGAFVPGMILAAVIAIQSKGSPFYAQERLGLNGRHFKLLKFRSMVVDANDVEKYFTPEQLREWELERKVDNDPRVTGVGHFLRKTSLDEFPQFINVLIGDMSVVGPRPIVDEELANYGDRAAEFLSCKPGITGWWQVEARNDADYASGRRQELELYYVRHASATLDWNIFVRTFGAVFRGTGK